ncbi:hypothetical protein AB838_16510 [Rhodobacteraceae bacterium (ex Bugula neritina AB1)]|nr:hypothetical protein AB838_16510 [Rhodobacteraceae bacterium (ex Bugula neritina AB1)]
MFFRRGIRIQASMNHEKIADPHMRWCGIDRANERLRNRSGKALPDIRKWLRSLVRGDFRQESPAAIDQPEMVIAAVQNFEERQFMITRQEVQFIDACQGARFQRQSDGTQAFGAAVNQVAEKHQHPFLCFSVADANCLEDRCKLVRSPMHISDDKKLDTLRKGAGQSALRKAEVSGLWHE